MKKILLVLLSLHSGLSLAEPRAGVKATLGMTTPDALELRYDLPAGCTRVDFANEGIRPQAAAAMRKDWKALDGCGEVGPNGIVLKDAACTSVRIHVPAFERPIDRVYPWAQQIEGGMFSHTSAFALAGACGPVDWTFSSSAGSVVVDGKPGGPTLSVGHATPYIQYAPVIFLHGDVGKGGHRHIDSRVAPAFTRLIERDLEQTYANFRKRMPGLNFPMPYVLTVAAGTGQRWQSDLSNRRTMRLSLPVAPTTIQEAKFRYTVTHEAAHSLQAQEFDERWKDEITPIKEGGAEFLAWLSEAQLGRKDRAWLIDHAEATLNRCLIAIGDTNYAKTNDRNWGRAPYDCGFTMHLLGLAGRQTSADPSLVMRDYYRDADQGRATDFARALECGDKRGCSARWLPRMLAGDETLPALMRDFATQTRVLRAGDTPRPAALELIGRTSFANLMAYDCKGQLSIYNEETSMRIGSVQRCATLRENMNVVAAEGLPLLTNAQAAPAMLKACRDTGKTTLGMDDGTRLEIPCNDTVKAPPPLYAIDPERLFKRLGLNP